LRRHLSPALVLSVIAIVLAMTAGATAATSYITGKQIRDGSLTGRDIKNRSIGVDDIQPESIGPSRLSSGVLDDIEAGKDNLPGPMGPAGATGPAGPTGPAGSTSVVTVTSPHQLVPSGGTTTAMRADCPPGMTVVGTGFNTGIGNADFVLSYGTFVGGFVDNDVSITIETYVQAVCASGATNTGGTRSLSQSRALSGSGAARGGDERFAADEAAARALHQ
jgi:hypothetical protein